MRYSAFVPALATVLFASVAHADAVLQVSAYDVTNGGSTPISLTPTSGTGVLTSSGSDSNFIDVSVLSSGAQYAHGGLSTTTLDVSGSAGTILKLLITETGLTAAQTSQLFDLSYTLNALTSNSAGSVIFSTYVSADDTAYGTSTALNVDQVLSGSSTVASFSTSALATTLLADGLYSETQELDIYFDQAGTITASAQITPVTATTPEPSSLVLLGSGLVGMAGMLRKRLRRSGNGMVENAA